MAACDGRRPRRAYASLLKDCALCDDVEFRDGEISGLERVDEELAFQHALVFIDHDFDQRLPRAPCVAVANDAPAVLRRPQHRGWKGQGPSDEGWHARDVTPCEARWLHNFGFALEAQVNAGISTSNRLNTPNRSSQPAFTCLSALIANRKKGDMRALWWRYTTRPPLCEDFTSR